MASGNFVLDKGYNAGNPLTKFRLVKLVAGTPETITPVTGITDEVIGVSQFACTAAEILNGKGGDVRILGISEVEAAGAIAIGQWCQSEGDGRVSALVGASGKKIVGKCTGFASTNAGDRISMLIVHTNAVA